PPPAPPLAPPAVDMATLEAAGLAVAGARRSRVGEEWRVVSGQLLRALRALPPRRGGGGGGVVSPNLLMVTSAKQKEGKSFSALNLAGSLALGSQAEVLLLDLDSKPDALSAMLGLGDRPGLFDLIADPALRPEDLVLTTAVPGFSILPIGSASALGPEAVERTVTRQVVAMIEKLARRFANRVVILDAAPCLATSDASTLAPTVDQIAMIVEAERTQRDDVEAALELLRPCANITLVLNKVRLVTNHAFGDYNYYDA
ncbi:MAG: hypothetical protein P4L71_00470, partial [Acetobacteraceae bacterium]|nr:hypothetical protein [Acetobacteraceae bacterium]